MDDRYRIIVGVLIAFGVLVVVMLTATVLALVWYRSYMRKVTSQTDDMTKLAHDSRDLSLRAIELLEKSNAIAEENNKNQLEMIEALRKLRVD
jgi:hypothetical protein